MSDPTQSVDPVAAALNYVAQVRGTALGLAMSGKDNPKLDSSLIKLHDDGAALERVLQAALTPQIAGGGEVEPTCYRYRFADPMSGRAVWRDSPATWNGQKPKETQPLYATPPAKAGPAVKAGIELAAKWVERRRDDYVSEHGIYDPSTGVTEFSGDGDEYVGELEEIIEGIRALSPEPPVPDAVQVELPHLPSRNLHEAHARERAGFPPGGISAPEQPGSGDLVSSCCIEDGEEPCGPFEDVCRERGEALARAKKAEAEVERLRGAFCSAIDFSLETDEGAAFLKCWNEGDWPQIALDWPEFDLKTVGQMNADRAALSPAKGGQVMRGTHFHIPFGEEAKHGAALKAGLACLPADFTAKVCPICDGHGHYQQTYTAGCGGGYFRSSGRCDFCSQTGLRQANGPAPLSVLYQVLNAAGGAEG